jgi:hypothetical protein
VIVHAGGSDVVPTKFCNRLLLLPRLRPRCSPFFDWRLVMVGTIIDWFLQSSSLLGKFIQMLPFVPAFLHYWIAQLLHQSINQLPDLLNNQCNGSALAR